MELVGLVKLVLNPGRLGRPSFTEPHVPFVCVMQVIGIQARAVGGIAGLEFRIEAGGGDRDDVIVQA